MGSCPHRNPGPVDDGRHVMGMGALHVEGDDGAPFPGPAEDAERVDPRQAFEGIIEQVRLMGGDGVEASGVDEVGGDEGAGAAEARLAVHRDPAGRVPDDAGASWRV